MNALMIQLQYKGYATWTRPGISLDADARARIASGLETTFRDNREGGWRFIPPPGVDR